MKYSVPDHSYFNLDGRLLRRMTMLYINIMPQYYDVSINKSDYKNIFFYMIIRILFILYLSLLLRRKIISILNIHFQKNSINKQISD